ncbi:MAG: SDR family NAD(P)-dependent oxidoreductase [Hyphomicrobiales bacterium]
MTTRAILITGCSSGIGLDAATALKARGYRVFATARKPEDLARLEGLGLEALMLDYRDSASVQACAAIVAERCGGTLFALFNNGAYGQPGAVEDLSRAVLEEQFAANVFGWHELTRACLPLLRAHAAAHGTARIVQCSSVLGLLALKWRGAYNASKFALEGLTDTLRLELLGTGIAVVTLNPGPIATRFVDNAVAAFSRNIDMSHSLHVAEFEAQRQKLARGGSTRFKLPPAAVTAKLITALEHPRPRPHFFVTLPTHVAALARRFLPARWLAAFAARNS